MASNKTQCPQIFWEACDQLFRIITAAKKDHLSQRNAESTESSEPQKALFSCVDHVCLFVMAHQRRSGDLDQRGQFTAQAILFTLGPLLPLTELILKVFGGHALRTDNQDIIRDPLCGDAVVRSWDCLCQPSLCTLKTWLQLIF